MKKLIEVALPIKEISLESVRDKSLRHGHISTLHLWWARRPLPASRAIVFASLVPDPDDPECPQRFQDSVKTLLASDEYKPFPPQEDTLRNRLLSFIAKPSQKLRDFETGASTAPPKPAEMLDDSCLVKWESSINPQIIGIARQLIEAAYGYTPTVLDPFAGGGAIPLEAVRLGCNVIANDYNPVAHLIERCTFEFPYKYGKPGKVKKITENGMEIEETVPNVLAADVEYHAKRILERVKKRIGHLYPAGADGNPVVGYLWARTVPCSNPSCRKRFPLLRSLKICDKPNKKVALTMKIEDDVVSFGIAEGKNIKETDGTMLSRGNSKCPFCGGMNTINDIRNTCSNQALQEIMVAVISSTSGGKSYRCIEITDIEAFNQALNGSSDFERPQEIMPHFRNINLDLYGLFTWGSIFNDRQMLAIQTFVQETSKEITELHSLKQDDVAAYLILWIGKISPRLTSVGRWHLSGEKLETPFDAQAIPMKWDYPEINPLNEITGGAFGQIEWITRVIERESCIGTDDDVKIKCLCGDGANIGIRNGQADVVITDPPYFDAIAYADLSDFFYIWFKRTCGNVFPDLFSTPLTPKSEEATALKHRHDGNVQKANEHFEDKLTACLSEAKRICKDDGLVAVMFAHQSTHAWSALISAIFKAGMTITATYPIDTEMGNRTIALGTSSLSSSVTVTCRTRKYGAAASFREVKAEIERAVKEAIERFWSYGFRGADLIVACYGPAVEVVGKYEFVERQGEPVSVVELLEEVRKIALAAIAGAFSGDVYSKYYYVIAQMYGAGETDWDDLVKIAMIGTGEEDIHKFSDDHRLILRTENKARLALLADRIEYLPKPERIGTDASLIDQLHVAMLLWLNEQRPELVRYLKDDDRIENDGIWRLAQSLFEVLPRDTEDWKLISVLLNEREALRSETRKIVQTQSELDLPFFSNSSFVTHSS